MVRSTFCIHTGDTRLCGPAQQVVACIPPAHGSVQKQSRLPFIGTGFADPEVTFAARLVHGMAKVLVQLRFQLGVLCKGALSVTGQQVESSPQQVCSKAVAEFLVGNGQGLVNAPADLRSVFVGMHVLSSHVMAALCQSMGFQSEMILETCLEEDFQ